MNGRRFLVNCLAVVLLVLPVRGAGGATLLPSIRQTTNAASARPAIVQLMEKLAAELKADDPTARERIIDEVLPGGANPAQPSAPFLDAFADVVNTELLKLANDPNPRVRLNAAIVAAKVGEKANNTRLIGTVVDLLDDPNEAVVSWALKATRGVLVPAHTPQGLLGPGAKLMPAFTAAAKKYVHSGPMTQIAYDSLKVVETGTPPAGAIKAAIDATQEIVKARRDLYLKGLPEFPSSESSAVSLLAREKIWKAQAPVQQLATIQIISDLTGLAAQHFASAGQIVRGELAGMLKTNGGALSVIGVWTNTAAKMDLFAKPLSQVGPTMQAETVMQRAEETFKGLTSVMAWKDLRPAPEIQK